jgi:hypothetical protein
MHENPGGIRRAVSQGVALNQPGEGNNFMPVERNFMMPERETMERARRDEAEGKAPSTQAGEFVREEIHHLRVRKHGARSTKQAIAIGLAKARRAGVKLPPRDRGEVSKKPVGVR